ncbi:MmcQ/YjbR family DNA-binding protein [Nitrospirillum sp. BR 11163]|uniref:MmcQ/YjbR family DNA-binding protein n=1 Tax=Nitrospirillum sp. BR 11163 TaxID=3104323 RepID=UPI002B0012A4|nr:MmcQ/YjbR family DNA-binding protein [Nitrospirillum sp. BR 11163]MEA1673955.1 MmcQ/YjbR family DNA-binding protein [Nitrospirillum sp. BR 11163]
MTPDDFRRIALSLAGVEEGAHMGHADFRVGNRIFATLDQNMGDPGLGRGMVKLAVEEQEMRVAAAPAIFQPVPGGWGRGGATHVHLDVSDEATLTGALTAAWRLAVALGPTRARKKKP